MTDLVQELRSLGHQAVTEGVNLHYVERMRGALYAAADELEKFGAADAPSNKAPQFVQVAVAFDDSGEALVALDNAGRVWWYSAVEHPRATREGRTGHQTRGWLPYEHVVSETVWDDEQ